MSSDVALRVHNLSKRFTIRHRDHDHVTLAQAALHRLRHPRSRAPREDFFALRDVTFDVPRGEVLAVIGHNGAGKSTLLKVLSRITPPTAGRVDVHGRIGSLLEVGTGFHPELTGRENIYLNGAILGMRRREIDAHFDAIVDFSGVQQFLDTPVKRFSSGMYVRLAFAVAAHLSTEILLLDEVLAVGDADFQRRCIDKMRDVAHDGRTVLLVSHNLSTVKELATSAVLLDRGQVVHSGTVYEAVDKYRLKEGLNSSEVELFDRPRPVQWMPGDVRIGYLRLHSTEGVPVIRWGAAPTLTLRLVGVRKAAPVTVSVTVRDAEGGGVGVCEGSSFTAPEPGETTEVRMTMPELRLQPGTYTLDVAVANGTILTGRTGVDIDKVTDALALEVTSATEEGTHVGPWWSGFGRVNLGNLTMIGGPVEAGTGGRS